MTAPELPVQAGWLWPHLPFAALGWSGVPLWIKVITVHRQLKPRMESTNEVIAFHLSLVCLAESTNDCSAVAESLLEDTAEVAGLLPICSELGSALQPFGDLEGAIRT
jgi:hypothetical protein